MGLLIRPQLWAIVLGRKRRRVPSAVLKLTDSTITLRLAQCSLPAEPVHLVLDVWIVSEHGRAATGSVARVCGRGPHGPQVLPIARSPDNRAEVLPVCSDAFREPLHCGRPCSDVEVQGGPLALPLLMNELEELVVEKLGVFVPKPAWVMDTAVRDSGHEGTPSNEDLKSPFDHIRDLRRTLGRFTRLHDQ